MRACGGDNRRAMTTMRLWNGLRPGAAPSAPNVPAGRDICRQALSAHPCVHPSFQGLKRVYCHSYPYRYPRSRAHLLIPFHLLDIMSVDSSSAPYPSNLKLLLIGNSSVGESNRGEWSERTRPRQPTTSRQQQRTERFENASVQTARLPPRWAHLHSTRRAHCDATASLGLLTRLRRARRNKHAPLVHLCVVCLLSRAWPRCILSTALPQRALTHSCRQIIAFAPLH